MQEFLAGLSQETEVLLVLSIILFAGFVMTRLTNTLNLPKVSGYIPVSYTHLYMSCHGVGRISEYRDVYTSVLLKAPDSVQQEILERLDQATAVSLVESRQQRLDGYRSMMGSMSGIMASMSAMGVVIGCVVIYVSSLISFEELKREISTLMALGLRDVQCLEVISVSQWLMAIGGMLLGIPMAMAVSRDVYKRQDLYQPKNKPSIIQVPEMVFIQVEGEGDPNRCQAYKDAMEILDGLSFTIKMSKMGGNQPEGYFEYVVPPLEGLWWGEDEELFDGVMIGDKSKFHWISMIRQPEFVTEEVFEWAKAALQKKKPHVDVSTTRLVKWEEGLCAQLMHIGPYDDEPATIALLNQFVEDNGYDTDINERRRHHEIYLGDPRKTAPERLKTVLRHPVKKQQ